MNEVSRILSAIEENDPKRAERLLPLVYEELRRLAARKLARERPDQSLQATALVHEAYLRVVESDEQRSWESRGEFFAAAAVAMRRILIERARRKQRKIHGGAFFRVPLDPDRLPDRTPSEDLLALDDALNKLAEIDPVKVRLVELRYFAGLTGDQAAQVLGISPSTADRYWAYSRAWLRREIQSGDTEIDSEPTPTPDP